MVDKLRSLVHIRHDIAKGKKVGNMLGNLLGIPDHEKRSLKKQKSKEKRNGNKDAANKGAGWGERKTNWKGQRK